MDKHGESKEDVVCSHFLVREISKFLRARRIHTVVLDFTHYVLVLTLFFTLCTAA